MARNSNLQSIPWSYRRLAILAATLLVTTATTGCDHAKVPDEAYVKLSDPRKFHAIRVAAETTELGLPLLPDGTGLSPNSYFDAVRFVRRYRQDGKGPMTIGVPPEARRNKAVADNIRTIRKIVAQAGVPGHHVRYTALPHHHADASAIVMSYDRIAAIPPACGDWSEDVQRNPERLPSPNFGCATQRNLAAMVATPTDLLYAAQETPRLSERRAAAFKAYVTPQQTTDLNVKTK